MMKLSRMLVCVTFGAVCAAWLVGCGGSSPATANKSESKSTEASDAKSPSASSTATIVDDGAGTEPAQSVAIFLDSLRKGDERAANGVLTTLARQELAKSTWVVQPLGSPAGQYRIGRVGFPYEDRTVALVECTWIEPPVDGVTQEPMEIVCEVHQEAEGWRISGIGFTIPGTDQPLVLDFEDAQSLQATMDAATGETTPQPATQVANQPTQPTQPGQVGTPMPSYPTGVEALSQQNAPGYPQLATPPLNAPINR